jgi:CheY-like chemotaxis protein
MGKTMLEEMGYTVETMTESTEALEAIQQSPNRFDLIITDKTMPRLTGIMLAEEVKKIRRHLPLILCTGYNNDLDLEDALKIGIRACVMKPFSAEDICGTVRKVLDEENKLRIKSLSR